jgi:membrane protein YdbS with pleckstrin-like domain
MGQPLETNGRSADLRLRAPVNLVARRAIWYWTLRAGLPWLVLIAGQVVLLLTVPGRYDLRLLVLGATVVLGLAHVLLMPRWRYRVHRWEASATAVYTQSGWFSQERRIAPLSRIQTVDTDRGPIEQLFGLANVTVTTASAAGPLRISGLASGTAERLVADLTAATAASTGDAT